MLLTKLFCIIPNAKVNPSNLPCIAVLEKTGFVRARYFKQSFYYSGKFLDSAIYSLICAKKSPFV